MNRRAAIGVIGAIVFLFGLAWFLQGVRIIPGSMMTGSQFWATAGAIMLILGTVVIASNFPGHPRAEKAKS
jgi:hypothetical protein